MPRVSTVAWPAGGPRAKARTHTQRGAPPMWGRSDATVGCALLGAGGSGLREAHR
jgi:hypothetical protein